jgi:PPP family 3-phenylpropionic acid transporter
MTLSPRARAVLAYIAVYAAAGALYPYLPLYYASLGFQLGEIGAVLALASLVGLLASPAWGALSDRYRGSPVVMVVATATALGGTVLLATAAAGEIRHGIGLPQAPPPEPLLIFAAAAILGAGLAGVAPILDARALETAGANRAGFGPLRAWGSFSYVLGAIGTGLLVDQQGPRALFPVLAATLVATGLVGLTLRPAAAELGGRRLETAARPLRDAGRLFGPRGLGTFLLGAFLAWLGMGTVLSFVPLRFAELGAQASVVGIAGAVAAAVEVPVMLRFPSLATRFGSTRLLVAGAGFIALRSILATFAPEPWILVAAAAFAGLGFALFFVGGVTYVSEHVPSELAATAQGIFQGVGNSLSQVVAAASGGAIAAVFGIQGLFAVGSALGLLATLIIWRAIRESGGPIVRRGYPRNPTQTSIPAPTEAT